MGTAIWLIYLKHGKKIKIMYKNKSKKNDEGNFFTKLNKKNIFVWEYQDDPKSNN